MPSKPYSHRGRISSNSRSTGSAAAFAGCIGLPEPSAWTRGEGSLRSFCSLFNERAEAWLENRSPECRAFVRADRAFRQLG